MIFQLSLPNHNCKFSLLLLLLGIITVVVRSDVRTPTIVNGGVYKIQSDNDQNVLTAADNGILTKSLGFTQTNAWTNTDDQKWTIRNSPSLINGKQLRSLTSRKNANNNIGFVLRNVGSTATLLQRYWELIHLGNGKWQLKSTDGKCLQNMGRTHAVEEKPCGSNIRSQKWEFLICNSLTCSDRK